MGYTWVRAQTASETAPAVRPASGPQTPLCAGTDFILVDDTQAQLISFPLRFPGFHFLQISLHMHASFNMRSLHDGHQVKQ